MKVAIIGANSFLAQYIIEEFIKNKENSLVLFGMSPIEKYQEQPFVRFAFPESEINFQSLLDFDIIIYTAGAGIQANTKESTELIYELNVFTPIKLTNYLSEHNYLGKLVTFGSYFEIGNEPNEKYYSEDELSVSNNKVSNEYCTSKRLLTRYFNSRVIRLNFFHLVLPNIYGKGENPNRLIPYLINSLSDNTEIKLTSGKQFRQYIHASDVASIVNDISMHSYQSGIYNLTNKISYSVKSVVKIVFKIANKESEFNESFFGNSERSDTIMPFLLLENEKAIKTFRNTPKITIEEGIRNYYEKN
jgi:nucleoside-diphosphate-sugar epimerase